MKKILAAVAVILFCAVFSVFAAELKVGAKAPDFSLNDAKGKAYSLASPEYKGMVTPVFYGV